MTKHAVEPIAAEVRGIGVDWAQLGASTLRSGNASVAVTYLRRATVTAPDNIDVLGNLAVGAHRLGGDVAAADWLRRLLAVEPQDVEALTALAVIEPDIPGRRRAARRSLGLSPSLDEGWSRIGALVLDMMPLAALAAFSRAAAVAPKAVSALVGRGLALGRLGRREAAATLFHRAAALAPDRVDAWEALGDASVSSVADDRRLLSAARSVAIDRWRSAGWYRLASCYWLNQRAADACRCYRVALALVPQLVEAVANLGAGLRETGDGASARRWFARAVVLAPDSAGAMTNLGTALDPGSSEARLWHRRALAWEPSHVHALNNLGSQDLAQNATTPALAWFRRAIDAGYPDAEALWNRGVARLVRGDLKGGFADYEHRWGLRIFVGWRRPFTEPLWTGEPADGRTILVHAEQGAGDTIQFVRYLAPLADRGFRVILECQPGLRRLLERVRGASAVIAKGETLPRFDLHVPLLSLPQRFGTTLSKVPSEVPYLHVDGSRDLASAFSGRRIGLVWAGNPQHRNDTNRSLSAAALDQLFAGLAKIPNLSVVSLQVGSQADGLGRAARQGLAIDDAASGFGDFADTAAAIRGLDTVVGVDTSVMHLTGALGRPGWLLLPYAPDWRWLLGRSDSPWYPTLRLYRQATAGVWSDVIDAVLSDLRGGG